MALISFFLRLYAYRSLVLLLLLGIAAGICYFLYTDSLKVKAEKQEIINMYAAQPPPTRTVDTQGRETVRVVTPVVSAAVLKDLKSGLASEMRDQIRAEFGRNAQLISAQRTQFETKQQLPTVALRDTTVQRSTPTGMVARKARAGTFKDPWLNLTGIVTDDSLSVKYTIRNEFDIRSYSKRSAKHWWMFWAPRYTYVDLKNRNPNSTTSGLEAVRVEKE